MTIMNAQLRDNKRIEQLRGIIAIAQEEIDAIESRNYRSFAYQEHVSSNWFTKVRYPSECNMPQGHPSHCNCY